MTPEAFTQLLTAANSIGTLGVLIFFVLAFYRGDILSKTVHDRIVKVYEDQAKELTTRLVASIERIEQKIVEELKDTRNERGKGGRRE